MTKRFCSLFLLALVGPIGSGQVPSDPPFPKPIFGLDFTKSLLGGLPPANEGAFMGGPTGTFEDAGINNSARKELAGTLVGANIPTNLHPSPLFGAQPFTQKLLLFEEFGTEPLDPAALPSTLSFPQPALGSAPEQDPHSVAASGPPSATLDAFLAEKGIAPYPTQAANTLDQNPWRAQIATFLKRPMKAVPAEGRPPGEGWSHQRWSEFFPQAFFKTAQAGARVNSGFRDERQRHHYRLGEFAPGGLYYNTAGLPGTAGTTKGIAVRFHPSMPVQDHNALWTFDGTLPPKLLMVRYGQPVLMRHFNALPIDPAANRGFGLHTITTHEHNGHTPAESDGFTNAFFFPGQFYDYRWPIQLAGYDTVNTTATDPRAAFPAAPGETLYVNDERPGVKTAENGSIKIRGDWRETMSTHWFHDHMLDFTAQNVYKGNAAMMNYYSALDRGKEDFDDGVNLRLPSGTALPWGNRDYDVNLVIADKAWDKDGQLSFNIFNLDGFIGDQLLTNWLYHPYLDVRARRYRLRILNGSVSRYLAIALVQEVQGEGGEMPGPAGSGVSYRRVPFYLIANDGNIMEHSVLFDGSFDAPGSPVNHRGQLPTLGIAERFDLVVDFAKYGLKPGDKLYFVNVLAHADGKRVAGKIPLGDVLAERYKPAMRLVDGQPDHWVGGDPCIGKFLEFRVQPYEGMDMSMDPSEYMPGKKAMIPLTIHRDDPKDQAEMAKAVHHTFEFARTAGTDEAPWTIRTDGGGGLPMDPRRISVAIPLANGPTPGGSSGAGTLQIWDIRNGTGGWSHPVHVHFEEGVILSRGGQPPPEWEKWARKDVYRVGPEDDGMNSVVVAIRFREFAGTYMEHCHNTQHEDHSMLLRWDIEHPGQVLLMPAPMPTWEGVEYAGSEALPDYRVGDGVGLQAEAPPPVEAVSGD